MIPAPARRPRRGFATFMALWAVSLAVIVLAALQSVSHRQAAAGRMAVARVRAYWAARGAIEAQIAALTQDTLSPSATSAFQVMDDLSLAARGTLYQASYAVTHTQGATVKDGAADAHAKLNINTMSKESMALLGIDDATADAITDWIDEDDDPEPYGAEEGQYLSQKYAYKPRNAPMHSLRELELVIGVRPEDVRGEDWNLNGLLDANEDDGDLSWPRDNADGRLDAGWSEHITAYSDPGLGPGYSLTGQPRLDLSTASADDLTRRLQIDRSQAEAILNHITQGGSLGDFLSTSLSTMGTGATLLTGQQQSTVANLTDDQLGLLLDEAYVPEGSAAAHAGKVNLNTVDSKTLAYLAELDSGIADAIISERDARSGGFVRLTDLLTIPWIFRATLAELEPYLDVRSQIFVATARGRDEASGVEIEIQAVLDRSTIPVVIRDLIVR